MQRRVLIIVGIIMALIVSGFAFLLSQPKAAAPPELPVVEDEGSDGASETNSTIGAYVDYSPETLANTKGTRVLFFHASWCPQCRELDASLRAGDIPAGVTIFKVDYDSHQGLRQQYGVTIQTTLVKLNAEGAAAKKYVAYDQPQLSAVKENLLQ